MGDTKTQMRSWTHCEVVHSMQFIQLKNSAIIVIQARPSLAAKALTTTGCWNAFNTDKSKQQHKLPCLTQQEYNPSATPELWHKDA